MPCKKSELASAINSFAAARTTGDGNLQKMAAHVLEQLIDTLGFSNEDKPEVSETEVVEGD